jgi:hypothetical protein
MLFATQNPQSEINPEQTASFISLIFFTFMDSIVMEGFRNPQLRYENLPPLCDYDRGAYIAKKMYKVSLTPRRCLLLTDMLIGDLSMAKENWETYVLGNNVCLLCVCSSSEIHVPSSDCVQGNSLSSSRGWSPSRHLGDSGRLLR